MDESFPLLDGIVEFVGDRAKHAFPLGNHEQRHDLLALCLCLFAVSDSVATFVFERLLDVEREEGRLGQDAQDPEADQIVPEAGRRTQPGAAAESRRACCLPAASGVVL